MIFYIFSIELVCYMEITEMLNFCYKEKTGMIKLMEVKIKRRLLC